MSDRPVETPYMFSEPSINLLVVLPVVVVALTGILLMVIDLFIEEERRHWLAGSVSRAC